MLALLSALTLPVAAQVPPKVLHVYVDPIFGDDGQAFANNPDADVNTARPAPFAQHPDAGQFQNDVPQGTIRHAPYSFHTLTGPQGVAAYLNSLDLYLQAETALAMIHCLPGIYGPATGPDYPDPIDHRSGLPFNGENWPFTLRWYWSLQGTSALDTVFDARGDNKAIIVVRADRDGLAHSDSIIDSLTIRGARSGSTYTPGDAAGAGIFISALPIDPLFARGTQIGVTISNCFLVDNHVAIGIDNAPLESLRNFPLIIGNTFARNWIGIWNGSRGPNEPNQGWATPTLLNNVFDSWRPGLTATATTPFVGVHAYSLAVSDLKIGGSPNWTAMIPPRSFCAWEAGGDYPVALPNWPLPALNPNLTAAPLPAPRVDLSPYTGFAPGSVRGTLFLNDFLRNAGLAGPFEYSANDFRLAPSVSQSAGPPQPFPLDTNPLVNRGIYIHTLNGHVSGIGGIRMQMATAVSGSPFCKVERMPGPPSEEFATLHAWDWDCEGFGNPRVVIRDDFPFTGNPNVGDTPMDLGADEMDDLIIAGYIEGTRILSSYVPGAPTVWDHRRLLFVNVADPLPRMWVRARYVQVDGQTHQWWGHVQGAPDASGGTNYTAGVAGSTRAAMRVANGKPLFMRNLECDFSPHLLADPHPMWPMGFVGAQPDIYAANPWWWQKTLQGGQPFTHDNGALYDNWNPALWPVHGTSNVVGGPLPFNLPRTAVLCGILNPPMTGLFPSGGQGMLYLNSAAQPPVFVSVAPCQGGGIQTYSVDARGLGDAGANCPDLVPVAPNFLGRRFNFQATRAKGAYTNLQTLLSVDGLPPILEGMAGQGPSPETARQHGRMVDVRLRGR